MIVATRTLGRGEIVSASDVTTSMIELQRFRKDLGDTARHPGRGRSAETIAGKRTGRLCTGARIFRGRVGAQYLAAQLFHLDRRQDRGRDRTLGPVDHPRAERLIRKRAAG